MVSARSFLVPFRYSEKITYMLEFSPQLLRFYTNGQPIMENNSAENENVPGPASTSDDETVVEIGSASSMVVQDDVRIILDDGVSRWSLAEDNEEDFYVLSTPYDYDDLWDDEEMCFKLQTIQHCDVLYIFSENHPIMVLKRYASHDWRLEELEINDGPFMAMNSSNIMIESDQVSGNVTLSANGDVFAKTDVGRLVRLRGYSGSEKIWSANVSVSSGDIYYSDNKYYQAQNGGTTGSKKPVHEEGVRSDGGVRWLYLHDGSGVVKISAYVGAREVRALVIKRLPEAVCDGTVYWEMGLLHQGGKYPRSGAFFRNRFAFLVNTAEGPKVCLSMAGDYNKFADMEYGETTAECAITVPVLNTEFNDGKWIYAHDVLFVGTGASEFFIDVISSASALSNDNVKIQQISHVGSKAIMPVSIGGHIFFADRFGLSLRDLSYNYYNDGYDQVDISLLGKHLFCSRIIGFCYQEIPDKILWCVTGDGRVTALTFSAEQGVAALSLHDFSGEVESLAVIPNFLTCRDEVWLEVKRSINGKTMRTVEYMENGMPIAFPSSLNAIKSLKEREKWQTEYIQRQAKYLDGAVYFVRAQDDNRTQLTGLSHLEGEIVCVFADGGVCEKQMVLNGRVEIKASSAMALVGKEVISQYVPQSIYLNDENGSGIGERQRVNHVTLMLYLSGGGKIGDSEENLSDILYRPADGKMNVPQTLFSGNKDILFNGATDITGAAQQIFIENRSPLPMNILAIVPAID